MATLDDLYTALKNADAAGDTAAATALAAHIKTLHVASVPNPVGQMPKMDPSAGGGTLQFGPFDTGIKTSQGLDNQLSGIGQQMTGLWNGAKRVNNVVSDFISPKGRAAQDSANIAEHRKLDAPLDDTFGGKMGNITGGVATVLPSMFIPGVNSMVGAGLVGSAYGLLQPSTSGRETALNTATGGIAGPLTIAATRLVPAIYQGGKALLDPLTSAGQDRIVGRTLQRFAGTDGASAADAAARMRAAAPAVPGVEQTVGMSSGNGGLAQLQRAVANNPETSNAFTQRSQGNTNALLDALQGIAGDAGKRDMFAADRSAAANALYGQAFDNYTGQLTPSLKGEVTQLLKRPSINAASKEAQTLALERGEKPAPEGSLQALHDVKQVIDDKISEAVRAGLGGQAKALQATQSKLLNVMDRLSPDYAQARVTYAEMSKPINRMDVGNSLLETLSPALNEVKDAKVLRSDAFANALRNGDKTAQKATGFSGATMESVLTPEEMATVQGVKKTLGQISDSQNLGRAVGSNTGQNLISQNVLSQIAGPLGMPHSFAENYLAHGLMSPIQLMSKYGEGTVKNKLAEAMLNPREAAALMESIKADPNAGALTNALVKYLRLGSDSLTNSSEKNPLQLPFRNQPTYQSR